MHAELGEEDRRELEEGESVGRRFLEWEMGGEEGEELRRRIGEVLGIGEGEE